MYLSGVPNTGLIGVPNFGYMLTPQMGNRPEITNLMPWAADTGCFKNPEAFILSRYFDWLRRRNLKNLLFATAPDKLGDWRATLDASLPVLGALNAIGIGSAFIAQDGLTPERTPWPCFGVLFLGGTDNPKPWKESRHAERLAREAKRRGKWLHMGRVNSARRMDIALDFGCDSVDGTFLAKAPDYLLPLLVKRVTWKNNQKRLFS